jgi:hypothetical protein
MLLARGVVVDDVQCLGLVSLARDGTGVRQGPLTDVP